MKSGEQATDDETWLRPLTLKSHAPKGRIHHAAFKGKTAIVPPRDPNNPWKSELSGRLLSLAGSIEAIKQDALQRVERLQEQKRRQGLDASQFVFSGVIYIKAGKVRDFDFMKANVIYTPTDNDKAHADLVVYDKSSGQIMQTDFIKQYLVNQFEFATPDDLSKINTCR